jgi:hypothetical protein
MCVWLQVVLNYGNKGMMCGPFMRNTDFSEQLSSAVIHTMFTSKKLRNREGGWLNVAQKHPSLGEALVWMFTDPLKQDKVTMWDVFGGTGALSFAAMDQGVSIIYTERDPVQFAAVKSMIGTYEKRRAIDCLQLVRVPRQLLATGSDFPLAANQSVKLWDPAVNIGRALENFNHSAHGMVPVRGCATAVSKCGFLTVSLCSVFKKVGNMIWTITRLMHLQ